MSSGAQPQSGSAGRSRPIQPRDARQFPWPPTFDDLIGTDKYIKVMPSCPGSGTYTIDDMARKPICSIPDHTLP